MSHTIEQTQIFVKSLRLQLDKRLQFAKHLDETYFTTNTFEHLQKDNQVWYEELNQHYTSSYANPDYAASQLPKEIASICCWIYYEVQMMMPAIFQNNKEAIRRIETYVQIVEQYINNNLPKHIYECAKEMVTTSLENEFKQNYTCDNFTTNLLLTTDIHDLRYLFRYGVYISQEDIEFAQLIQKKDDNLLQRLAKQMVDSYTKGFQVRNKKKTNRITSRFIQIVGLEPVGKHILKLLEEKQQHGIVAEIIYKNINPQALYDHRQDECIYLSNDYITHKENIYKEVCLKYKESLLNYLGNIIMVSFGQNKLITIHKETAPHKDESQNTLSNQYEINTKIIFESYVPKAEISFTGMAFPCREICDDNFEKIFDDIMEINLMDSQKHEAIQEILINVLDRSDFVEIIGGNGNKTHIQVKLPKLRFPKHQSNFSNCGADVNNPVGEVFTSPQLKGTNGLLHIHRARISKVAFEDIEMEFEDGFVKKASCQNFADPQKNEALMQEVIFHHRETLPMGEFALGTNTFAYVKAKEDGILYKLHTLIFEKLGPHMAIGDTCFAWSEDNMIYSLYSGKEVIAKDNEFSIQRFHDVSKAYTGIHYDLTIPYDEIHCLTAHHYDGSTTKIVQDGLFVLDGCEYLNEPLKGA